MKRVCCFLLLISLFILPISILSYGQPNTDVDKVLKTGKELIERDEYVKAVDCLGEILAALGNETNDPKITAFGATVQAYGLWKLNNPQMVPMAKQYLNQAISKDPGWKFPQKLLKEIENNK